MSLTKSQIESQRERVINSYNSAKSDNKDNYEHKVAKATEHYIYPNQIEDANRIVEIFHDEYVRVVSVQKKTKVGADGLMIEIAKLMTTHNDDNFILNLQKIRILTGMSNKQWETDMKDKAPSCFKDKIFHHGQLSNSDLENMQNGLIIIDEIDTGDKESQVLHETLKAAKILDVEHMKANNNRFVIISATMIKELYDMKKWGSLHQSYKMTIPSAYFGHTDMLKCGIIQDSYPLNTVEEAERWIEEDILQNYGKDYRVHIVRVTNTTLHSIRLACIRKNIKLSNHTSDDRLSDAEKKEFFTDPLKEHIVIAVKGFWRRAELIPNSWKLRIGATHELWTRNVDNNVQIQGLPGRMTGYWRSDIESGHKTGPYRTSIKAIEEYEENYANPFIAGKYQTSGFKKRGTRVVADPTMISTKNIANLKPVVPAVVEDVEDIAKTVPIVIQLTEAEYKTIKRKGIEEKSPWNEDTILPLIEKYNPEIFKKIKDMPREQFLESDKDKTSYIKNIIPSTEAALQKKPWGWLTRIKYKYIDSYQIYMDTTAFRLIVIIHQGSKLTKPEVTNEIVKRTP